MSTAGHGRANASSARQEKRLVWGGPTHTSNCFKLADTAPAIPPSSSPSTSRLAVSLDALVFVFVRDSGGGGGTGSLGLASPASSL